MRFELWIVNASLIANNTDVIEVPQAVMNHAAFNNAGADHPLACRVPFEVKGVRVVGDSMAAGRGMAMTGSR